MQGLYFEGFNKTIQDLRAGGVRGGFRHPKRNVGTGQGLEAGECWDKTNKVRYTIEPDKRQLQVPYEAAVSLVQQQRVAVKGK